MVNVLQWILLLYNVLKSSANPQIDWIFIFLTIYAEKAFYSYVSQ